MKKRYKDIIIFFTGMMTFFVSQLLIRIPILKFLAGTQSFLYFQYVYPEIYLVFLAITAGLAEESVRYAGCCILQKKDWTLKTGILYGIGHGMMEVIWILSMVLKSNPTLSELMVVFIERSGAILIHAGMALIIITGYSTHKKRWIICAILLHALIDCMVGLPLSIIFMESIVVIIGALTFMGGTQIFRKNI